MSLDVSSVKKPLLQDERGISIIEMMTGLLLFGMVASILYSFLFMGTSMYGRITTETQLRNQLDALYGQVIHELSDAIYVQKEDALGKLIIYVKRAPVPTPPVVPPKYVESYRMVIEELGGFSGVSVYGPDSSTILSKRYDITSKFQMDLVASSLTAENQNMVGVNLMLYRTDELEVTEAERKRMSIQSKIPLFRIE